MLRDGGRDVKYDSPKKIFNGVHFVLFGFDSVSEAQYRSELVDGGGDDVGRYDFSCTHVIVSGRVFDESICAAARNDGKILVTELWIDDSLRLGMLANSKKVLYRPVRDLNGIPGSKSLHICLTGYQGQERENIMRMVSLMGGRFSKPLIANQITHLICYKFEGEKYQLAKRVNIEIANHIWLEDCLKAWEILSVENYKRSGWEMEMLEAEAMDSEVEEGEDAENKVLERSNALESRVLQGQKLLNTSSCSLMEDTKNFDQMNHILATKPSDLSVGNQLISPLNKESCSGISTNACDTKAKVFKGDRYLKGNATENKSNNYGIGVINSNQLSAPDLLNLSMKCDSLPFNARKNLMGIALLEEERKLATSNYSGKIGPNDVLLKEQFNNFSTPHNVKSEELHLNGKTNISLAESKNGTKPHLEQQTSALPKKLKRSAPKSNSRSLKLGKLSKSSDSPNALKSISSLELDFLKSPQIEPEIMVSHNGTNATNICDVVENNDVFLQLEKPSVSSTLMRSLESKQKDLNTYTKQNTPTSVRPGQIESSNAPDYEMGHGITPRNGNEGNALVQHVTNQCEQLSKSSSLKRKRKFKHHNSAFVSNLSDNSSSILDNKHELLSVPSKTALNVSVPSTNEPVFGVKLVRTSETTAFSDCSLKNQTGRADDKSVGIDFKLTRSSRHKTSMKDIEKSLELKSHNLSGNEILSSALERQASSTATTEIPESHKKGKANKDCISVNTNIFDSWNRGFGSKPSRKICKDKSLCANNTAIKSSSCEVKSKNVDRLTDMVKKEVSSFKKGEMEQNHLPVTNSNAITPDKKNPDLETENEIKDGSSLLGRENDDYVHKMKKISRSTINSSSKHNISRAVVSEPMWFILSGHLSQRCEFKKIIKRLRGRVCKDSHNWTYEATHFIVPDCVRRTQKFFAAAAAGRWILKSNYLTASDEAGKFLDEEPFEWYKKGLTEDGAISLEAPRKWRTLRKKTGHGAFFGMRIIIYGECIAPSLDTLKRVVKAGDGTILATSPPYTRFFNSGVDFAVVATSMPHIDIWVQEFLRNEIPCILSDYLVEYVCKPGFSLERHVLYNTHKWAQKSLSNLLSRSDEVVLDNLSGEENVDDLKCAVCGASDREEVMLICGDQKLTRGCGVGNHINCCDPPLVAVPEDDWFCSSCSKDVGQKGLVKPAKKKVKRR